MSQAVSADSLELLDREMAGKHLMGFWHWGRGRPPLSRTTVQAHLWRWDDVYPCLVRAADLVDMDRSERRVALLTNPGLANAQYTSHTIHTAIQYLKPHEQARTHRHTAAALRFILRGTGRIPRGRSAVRDGRRRPDPHAAVDLARSLATTPTSRSCGSTPWTSRSRWPCTSSLRRTTGASTADPGQQRASRAPVRDDPSPTLPDFPLLHYRWRDTLPPCRR